MNHLGLFAGILGFEIAAHLAGMKTVAVSEIEPYCCELIKLRMPGVRNLGDIKNYEEWAWVDNQVNLSYIDSDGIYTNNAEGNMPGPRNPKYDNSPDLYNGGMSIQECADFYEITRQAMWKILKRRGVAFRDQKKYGDDNNFYRGGQSFSKRCHRLLERAVGKGLIKPQPCSDCGSEVNPQAHHDDYNKPLDVRWYCKKCHFKWHKTNKAITIEKGEEEHLGCDKIDVITAGVP